MNTSTDDLHRPSGQDSGNRSDYFSGRIDEVKVYSTALTASEAAAIYANGSILPTPWLDSDVGTPPNAGYSMFSSSSDIFSIKSYGYNIDGTSDSANYLWQALPVDGSISVQIFTMSGSTAGKAGLMIRRSSRPRRPFAGIFRTYGGQLSFVTRSVTAGTAVTTSITSTAKYLKLTRIDNIITAYYSADGSIWTQLGSTINLGSDTLLIGLAASSQSPTAASTVSYKYLSLTKEASVLNQRLLQQQRLRRQEHRRRRRR